MNTIELREMIPRDRHEVAELICLSTNYWYQSHGFPIIFPGGPTTTTLHFDLYHSLPGSGGLVAVDAETGKIVGSCFRHDRPTHVSLGIMNVHPNHFGRRIARRLLTKIVEFAEARNKPIRLVSSAMNLDSFSLYTRAGFTPRCAYQDMYIKVPEEGMERSCPGLERVRPAVLDDIPGIVGLEKMVSGIERPGDYEYFISDSSGIWQVFVCLDGGGGIEGVLASCRHPGCNMIGPGVSKDAEVAGALLLAQLNHNRGATPVFLIPVEAEELVAQAYSWGGRNCEIHFHQVRGSFPGFNGIAMPTFLPESG